MKLKGKRATVMGLGRHGGGVGVSRWLAEQGCQVTVTDLANEEHLADSLASLKNVPIDRYVLGKHDEADFRRAQIVVVNPAVKPANPLVKLARKNRAIITSETELFLNHCPAQVIGVTGTTGKSTTCTMLAEIFRHAGRCTWLGGNIGNSLLADLKWMQKSDIVVLELSSFQIYHLSSKAKLPSVAVITNLSPNHLDWHGTWTDYLWTKQRLIGGGASQTIVLSPCTRDWCNVTAGIVVPLVDARRLPTLTIAGSHNRHNARLAATTAIMLGVSSQTIKEALGNFTGLPHRLELVGEVEGRRFYNDSKATSAAATMAALSAVKGPLWLLAGGADHQADWRKLASQICTHAKGTICYGASRDSLFSAVRQAKARYRLGKVETLAEAVALAFEKSKPGDAILLSPACPSFDQFPDFEARGRLFAELVQTLAHSHEQGSKPNA